MTASLIISICCLIFIIFMALDLKSLTSRIKKLEKEIEKDKKVD